MTLGEVIDAYVALQSARGVSFEGGRALLSQFRREMGNPPIDYVCAEAVVNFLQGSGALSATWLLKHRVPSGLYRFAIGRGHVDKSPLPVAIPKLPLQQTPYVYSNDELRGLLDATKTLHVAHSPLRAPMYRSLLLLLYGSGLRVGEALRLTLRDVDLDEGVITVRDTKFYKSRLVPVGPKLAQEMAAFAALRRRHPLPDGESSRFFTTRGGRGCSYQAINIVFQRLRRAAGIVCPPGESKPPRLHDLRHTAAVHRVIAWYRSGQDVQRLLPHLATYLGHIDVKSTQRYLKMTPELLHEASQRFSSYSQWGATVMTDKNLLGPWIRRFLLKHLVTERSLTRNTQASYRDTLTLLLPFAGAQARRSIDHMAVEDLTPTIVRRFLEHIETDRRCCGSTRNQRLATIHSLARFIDARSPVHLAWCTEVRFIPFKKTAKGLIGYLEKAEIDALLNQPDQRTALGARDHALLLFLYNSGARADEAAKLVVNDLQLGTSPSVRILGKGNKLRICPLWPRTSSLLSAITRGRGRNEPVFLGRTSQPMTRFGVHRVVTHYAKLVVKSSPSLIGKRVSPPTIRHTTAVHLLRAGVDINTIRAWLGHVSLDTTNI